MEENDAIAPVIQSAAAKVELNVKFPVFLRRYMFGKLAGPLVFPQIQCVERLSLKTIERTTS